MLKCIDGICRKSCEIPYSACSQKNPLRCSDGRCVKLISDCVSIRCKPDKPFLCPDGTCKDVLRHCKYPNNIKVIETHNLTTNENYTAFRLYDQSQKGVGMIYSFNSINLHYKGIALSSVQKTELDIDKMYEPLYYAFFSRGLKDITPNDFLRSSIIKITTNTQDDRLRYKKALQIHLNADVMKVSSKFAKIPKYVT